MSQLAGLKCLDKYGFPLAGYTAAEQAVRTEAAARETKLQDKWSRQVGSNSGCFLLSSATELLATHLVIVHCLGGQAWLL